MSVQKVTNRLSNKLSIEDVDLKNKRVLIRVDFNIPLENGRIKDKQRIEGALPTIRYALDQGAKVIILMSHLGRPDGKRVTNESLKPVANELKKLLNKNVKFVNDCVGEDVERAVNEAKQGEIILLENLRFHLEEEGSVKDKQGNKIQANKESIEQFRSDLSKLGDIYINDAFGAAHRAHSSIVGIQCDKRAAGYLMKKELDYFGKILENPEKPFLAILGGAKVSDKIKLIENLLDKVDELIIGGGMAFTFLKEKDKMQIGKSIYDAEGAKSITNIFDKAKDKNVQIHLPIDFIIAKDMKSKETRKVTKEEGISGNFCGFDIGEESINKFIDVIHRAKTIVWNGPMGVFEQDQFANGTRKLLEAVAERTKAKAITIIGGGDTATACAEFGFLDQMSHVSTGGGASLELLEGKALPGVISLSDK